MQNQCLSDILIKFGFVRLQLDEVVFVMREKMLIVSVFVDDMKVYGRTDEEIFSVIDYLKTHFKLVDRGPLKRFLGIDFIVESEFIGISSQSILLRISFHGLDSKQETKVNS